MIPVDLRDAILKAARERSVLFSYLQRRPPPKPRPWYRRAWTRIDRYLPRVRVSIGPRDPWGRFEDRW